MTEQGRKVGVWQEEGGEIDEFLDTQESQNKTLAADVRELREQKKLLYTFTL